MFYRHIYDGDDGEVGGGKKLCFGDDGIKQASLTRVLMISVFRYNVIKSNKKLLAFSLQITIS